MVGLGIVVVLLVAALAGGAWMMLTSLTPRDEQRTYCARCGGELTEADVAYCPKCQRRLVPEMRVTCAQSAIAWPRLGRGAAVLVAALVAALVVLPLLAPAGDALAPAASQRAS